MSKLVTPHATVLIWNYVQRLDSYDAYAGVKGIHSVEPVIIATSSLISISTSKSKDSPSGSFEIRLAPRFNWVSKITPGSWVAILMSQSEIPQMSQADYGQADRKSFKMLGRIDAVRATVDVNSETGARSTSFIVTGFDWGSVFNSILYIDQTLAETVLHGDAIGQKNSLLFNNMYTTYSSTTLPFPHQAVQQLIGLWGAGAATFLNDAAIQGARKGSNPMLLSTNTTFQLPNEVSRFMKQKDAVGKVQIAGGAITPIGATARNWADMIMVHSGILKKFDDPDPKIPGWANYEVAKESQGWVPTDLMLGQHTLWQLIAAAANSTLYEIVSDIRWDGNFPQFALYHRVRPFITNPNFMARQKLGDPSIKPSAFITARKITSLFKNIRRIDLETEDVIHINYGTNWRDKVNFIEIKGHGQLLPKTASTTAKLEGQTVDRSAFERDGFMPMFEATHFIPLTGDDYDPLQLTEWKYVLREWHANTHTMLNGAVVIVGQNEYIQVGDNIRIPSEVLGMAPINETQKRVAAKFPTFLLAHVQNVQHSFNVDPSTGARTFTTTILFVRGIITLSNGTLESDGPGALDQSAATLAPPAERLKNVFGVSTETDPDIQKLGKGKRT